MIKENNSLLKPLIEAIEARIDTQEQSIKIHTQYLLGDFVFNFSIQTEHIWKAEYTKKVLLQMLGNIIEEPDDVGYVEPYIRRERKKLEARLIDFSLMKSTNQLKMIQDVWELEAIRDIVKFLEYLMERNRETANLFFGTGKNN